MKELLLISTASIILLAACSGDTGTENAETDNQTNEENIEMSDSENDQEVEDNGNSETDANSGEDQDQTDNDETEGIEEGSEELSEIVYMSEEERLAHHQDLAVNLEDLSDEVYENLMLPGIHENTEIYEGRINPGDSLLFEIPDAEEIGDRTTLQPEVSKDGYFVIETNNYTLEAGENIRIYIMGNYTHEQTFDLPIHEAQEGMEEVHVRETSDNNDTSEYTIEESDTLASIADQYNVSSEELQKWNNILDPSEIESGMTIKVDGPTEEQAQKEEWQLEFEQNLYDNYDVTVREYEDIGDGYYGVYVNEHDTGDQYYVTVDSETGDFHG